MKEQQAVQRAKEQGELTLRVASALTLAVAALVLAYLGVWAFTGLVAAVATAMSWEWSNVIRRGGFDPAFMAHAGFVALAAAVAAAGLAAPAILIVAVGAAVVAVLQFRRVPVLSAIGVVYVGLPVIALVSLRQDGAYGFAAVVFVLIMVWSSDTFAMVSGRTIGGPRLWPTLSPKKTWAGLVGGVTSSCLIAGLVIAPWLGTSMAMLGLVGLGLGLTAQCGDLLESALKRYCGVKDASDLIPGHGGFLDRLDGVVTAAPVAVLIGLIRDFGAPAKALLFGP